jgi:hypothetical protein
MKKNLVLIIMLPCFALAGGSGVVANISSIIKSATTTSAAGGLTTNEIISGLKEALSVGATNSTALAAQKDGFNLNPSIRIPFPPAALKVKKTVEQLGCKVLVSNFELAINRSAEEASKKALPIFAKAIMNMSISDAMSILRGPNNAATEYLKSKTKTLLAVEFSPVVHNAIQTAQVTKYWSPIASTYNKTTILTHKSLVNPNLDQYVTDKTLDGLFYLIAQEELKIRVNPSARVTEILKKVFGAK